MDNIFKTQSLIKNDILEDQEEIDVPLKKQVPNQRMVCQIHSTGQKREEIKYINIGFIAKNKPDFCRTFLCDICYREFNRKNPSNQDLKKILSLKRFQYKYIESVFEKYPNQNFDDLMISLQRTETKMCSEIDSLNQTLNQYCETYKRNIKEFFQTLKNPIDKNQLQKFIRGKMNQGMIEDLYKNHKKVNKYDVLIGNKSKQVLQVFSDGFDSSMELISKDVKVKMNASFDCLKQFIQKYNKDNQEAEKSEKMVAEIQQKKQTVLNLDQRKPKSNSKLESASNNLSSIFEQRKTSRQVQQKKQIKNKKEAEGEQKNKKRRGSSSEQSDDSSNSDSLSSNSDKHLIKDQNADRIRDSHKHKAIQKQSRDKPYRTQNIVMIDQQFIKDSRNRTALYVVLKANTVRSGAQRVFRMDVEEFKRRYPFAFNRYVNLRDARK